MLGRLRRGRQPIRVVEAFVDELDLRALGFAGVGAGSNGSPVACDERRCPLLNPLKKSDPLLESAANLANVGHNPPLPIEEDMQGNFFDENYRAGCDSGFGSLVSSTATYRYIIESFIRLNDVRSVLDLGCGDWQFSKLIPWDNYDISYLGLDVSRLIIEKNAAIFGTERRQFKVIHEPSEILGLGRFDLVLCKDVLIHLPNSLANEYLDVFVAIARYSLITVDAFPSDRINGDITLGDYRAMDIRKPPFSRNSSIIAEYVNFTGHIFWVKYVHLLTGQSHRSQAHTLISAGEAMTHQEIRSTLRLLRPNKAKRFNKARFGSPNDGGYVLLDDFRGVDTVFSFGIEQNASWDMDVAQRGLTVYQFDHTVDAPISGDPRFIFAKKESVQRLGLTKRA